MANAKAHMILVHGAYHQPHHWDPLVKLLESAGYPVSVPRLPSVGSRPLPDPMAKDTATIKDSIVKAINEGATSVIPVLHSYAGFPGFDALASLGGHQKAKIPRVICISAFIVPQGVSMVDFQAKAPPTYAKAEGDYAMIPIPIPIFYNDVAPDLAAKAASTLLSMPVEAFTSPAQHEGWAEFPVAYVVCTKDNAIPVADQLEMVETCRKREGRMGGAAAVELVTLQSSHSPMLSMPVETAAVIGKVAGESS